MSKKEWLTYEEVVDIVDKSMIDSELRDFCTEYCKGNCCSSGISGCKEPCYKTGIRRLECSVFICFNLCSMIFTKEQNELYREIRRLIDDIVKSIKGQLYFRPLTKKQQKRLKKAKFPLVIKKFPSLLSGDASYRISVIRNITSECIIANQRKIKGE